MQLHPSGFRIAGRYEVAGRPLIGGMGIVYVCFDHQEQRPVALKTFKPEYLSERAARERFLHEGNIWMRLGKHPHIVRCHSVFQDSPRREAYLVLELVAKEEGCKDASLRAWLTPGKPVLVDQALLIALQIVRGMRHATDTIPGFVHRDLKPENILIGADHLSNAPINRVRVTDFGLVTALSAEQAAQAQAMAERDNQPGHLTCAGALLGSPHYMAPEQWESTEVDVQADIYAFGCILYEIVTGRMLVQGKTLDEVQRAHQGGQALANARSISPAFLQNLLVGCLALDPGKRDADWTTLERDLTIVSDQAIGLQVPEAAAVSALSRAEHIHAGWSFREIGRSYMDIGNAQAALNFFDAPYRPDKP